MRQKFNIYTLSTYPLFRKYMETRRIYLEEDKEFSAYQVRYMSLKKYNNLLTLGRWYIKDSKYAKILSIVGVDQKLMESKKTLDKI